MDVLITLGIFSGVFEESLNVRSPKGISCTAAELVINVKKWSVFQEQYRFLYSFVVKLQPLYHGANDDDVLCCICTWLNQGSFEKSIVEILTLSAMTESICLGVLQ